MRRRGTDQTPAMELHIDELRLDGFDPAQRADIVAAIEHALTRLIATGGLPSGGRSGHVDHVDGGTFRVSPQASAATIGDAIAHQIYHALYQGGHDG